MTKRKVWLWIKPNSPVSGANANNYCYETTVEGKPWLADIEEDQMFEPETFEVDPDPCGRGFADEKQMREWLKSRNWSKMAAREVGYVEDGKLYITKQIEVESGWGGPIGAMFCTSRDYIKPNVEAK